MVVPFRSLTTTLSASSSSLLAAPPVPPLSASSGLGHHPLHHPTRTIRPAHGSQAFYDATVLFSYSQVVSISNVIPLFDRLDEYLSTQATRTDIPATIRAACALAKKVLNDYYQKTDDSEIYRISMGMFFLFISCCYRSNYIVYYSATPSTQATILPADAVGARMDQHGQGTHAQRLGAFVRQWRGGRSCGRGK